MSEPITPKADRHVVEGEFVDSDVNLKTEQIKPKAGWVNRHRNLWLWVVVMTVSGAAFSLALAAWLNVQQLMHQQQSLQQLEQQVTLLQQQLDQTNTDQQRHLHQLTEMQQAWQTLFQHFDGKMPSELPADSTFDAAIISPIKAELETLQQRFNDELQNLNERLTAVAEATREAVDETDVAVVNQQMQDLDNALQQQLLQLNQQLTTLSQQQAEFAEKIAPKVEEMVTEIRPGLEGLMSRFNQLFTIKKHAPEEAESQP